MQNMHNFVQVSIKVNNMQHQSFQITRYAHCISPRQRHSRKTVVSLKHACKSRVDDISRTEVTSSYKYYVITDCQANKINSISDKYEWSWH